MTNDITYIIANLLRQTSPDLESRLGFQSEALYENRCIPCVQLKV